MCSLVDPAACGGKLLFAGIAAEAEADRRARLAIRQPNRAQHMRGATRTTGASRPQRKGDVAHVGNQSRGIQYFTAKVQIAMVATRQIAVNNPALPECCKRNLR